MDWTRHTLSFDSLRRRDGRFLLIRGQHLADLGGCAAWVGPEWGDYSLPFFVCSPVRKVNMSMRDILPALRPNVGFDPSFDLQ